MKRNCVFDLLDMATKKITTENEYNGNVGNISICIQRMKLRFLQKAPNDNPSKRYVQMMKSSPEQTICLYQLIREINELKQLNEYPRKMLHPRTRQNIIFFVTDVKEIIFKGSCPVFGYPKEIPRERRYTGPTPELYKEAYANMIMNTLYQYLHRMLNETGCRHCHANGHPEL